MLRSCMRCGIISVDEPFERGNLDAARISWLFNREIVPAETPFDPESYEALLQIDEAGCAPVLAGSV